MHRHLDRCPNCKREFYAHAEGAYCPECWSAWCRNDGTYEQRTVRRNPGHFFDLSLGYAVRCDDASGTKGISE